MIWRQRHSLLIKAELCRLFFLSLKSAKFLFYIFDALLSWNKTKTLKSLHYTTIFSWKLNGHVYMCSGYQYCLCSVIYRLFRKFGVFLFSMLLLGSYTVYKNSIICIFTKLANILPSLIFIVSILVCKSFDFPLKKGT